MIIIRRQYLNIFIYGGIFMDIQKLYQTWCEKAVEDADLTAELASVKDDENEIYERFYTALTFGTAGLRGVIGAGTNRMNIYVVRQATQGLANYVIGRYGGGAVAISYDSRIKADLFAKEAAKVLAANGIKAYLTTRRCSPTWCAISSVRQASW